MAGYLLKKSSHRFADRAALYLTQRQEESKFLLVACRATERAPHTLFPNFEWRPARSVHARVTYSYRGYVWQERIMRYPAEVLFFRDRAGGDEIATLLCQYFKHYFGELESFLNRSRLPSPPVFPGISDAGPQGAPLYFQPPDCIRIESDVQPSQFDLFVFWVEPEDNPLDSCSQPRPDLPGLSPETSFTPMPSPDSQRHFPVPFEPVSDDLASNLNPGSSPIPPGSFPGDFGNRNPVPGPNRLVSRFVAYTGDGCRTVTFSKTYTFPASEGSQPSDFAWRVKTQGGGQFVPRQLQLCDRPSG